MCDEVGRIVRENAVGCQGLVLNESVNRSLTKETCKRMKKPKKKKLLKYQVSRMHLRSSFLFMAFLGPRKKIHKRCKRRKTPDKEKLMGVWRVR